MIIIGCLLLTGWISVRLFVGPRRRTLDEFKSPAQAFLSITSFNDLYDYSVVLMRGFALGLHIGIATHDRVRIDGLEGDFPEQATYNMGSIM